ncbi:hypothetical protein ACJJTC_004422 [Scirpophaga incertulas]
MPLELSLPSGQVQLANMDLPEAEPLKKDTAVAKKRTFKEKFQHLKDNITLEPTLACYVIPSVLSKLATQNLNLDKACRVNKNYGDAVCDALLAREGTNHRDEELAVQQLIAGMESWKTIILTAIPSFLILFLGAWSDRTRKRKICILLPIVGELLVCISNIVNVYYFHELPAQVTMFFEAFFPAITGSWITTYMGAFSYIADISDEESRTFRTGVLNLCLTAGAPIGSAISGILLQKLGYYGVFCLSSVMYLFSIVYGFINIKDPEMLVTEKPREPVNESSGVWGFLKSFFDVNHVKATLEVAFKKGPNNRRTKSILVLASIAFIYGPYCGEFSVRYLFARYKFNWDALMFSFYNTFYICMHLLGALISISLFSRRWQWDDSVLGLISSSSKLVGALATGLARNSLEMYLAIAVETFNATSYTAMRSISSKLVTSDELGKMVAVFNLAEIVTYMVFSPIYSWTYMMTVKTDAGIVYYISAVLTILPLIFFSWFYRQHKKTMGMKATQSNEKVPPTENSKKNEEALINSIEGVEEMIMC